MPTCAKKTVNKMRKTGKLIVFEGIDGAGKTTQIRLLEDYLQKKGRSVVCTAEPTDLPTGKALRRALSGEEKKTACELATLFTLDRIAHNVAPGGILEQLEQGNDVICDRYFYSTLAYQGSETDEGWVRGMNLNCPQIRHPDLCIFLDLSPEESMARINSRAETHEIYETREQLEKIRNRFLTVLQSFPPQSVRMVNAARSIDEIQAEIRTIADEQLF